MLRGQARPEGLGAIVYHGLLQGLAVILRSVPPTSRERRTISASITAAPLDPQLIGVLANMLLKVQSGVRHAI